jgi:hypothetical protein
LIVGEGNGVHGKGKKIQICWLILYDIVSVRQFTNPATAHKILLTPPTGMSYDKLSITGNLRRDSQTYVDEAVFAIVKYTIQTHLSIKIYYFPSESFYLKRSTHGNYLILTRQ